MVTGNFAGMDADVLAIQKIGKLLSASCQCSTRDRIPTLLVNGHTIKGLATIAKYHARQGGSNALLGGSPEEEAAICQWIEYRTTHVDPSEKQDAESVLKDLNNYLSDKVYFVTYHPTLADIFMYYGLHRLFSNLTFLQKQQFVHVSRWFDNIQHVEGVRQDMPLIHFSKTKLYTGSSH